MLEQRNPESRSRGRPSGNAQRDDPSVPSASQKLGIAVSRTALAPGGRPG